MKHISAILLIVLIVFLPSCRFFKRIGLFGKKDDPTIAWQLRQDSIRVADSLKKVQDQLMAIENAKLDSARRAEEDRIAAESRTRFNIIVGSFITPEYAKGLAEVYQSQGYDTKIIKMEGTNFELVSAESHESFRTAVARLKEYQDTVELDSWLYIRK